jgi:hypothetical protein
VFLEPTVTFIHLQQSDELLDKFVVGFSIYTGLKNKGTIIRRLEMAHHTTVFFVDAKNFQCNYVGVSSPLSVVLAIYETTEVEPRFVCKTHLI